MLQLHRLCSSFVSGTKRERGLKTKKRKWEGKGRKKSIFRPQALVCLIREFYFHLITPKETWPEMTQRAKMLLITWKWDMKGSYFTMKSKQFSWGDILNLVIEARHHRWRGQKNPFIHTWWVTAFISIVWRSLDVTKAPQFASNKRRLSFKWPAAVSENYYIFITLQE